MSRVWPTRDDKVLADWNGLMIAALANAGAVFDEPAWVAAAEAVFAFVCGNMVEDGRLRHSWRADRLRHAAVLDDYANLSRAALALHEATGRRDYVDQAEAWAAVVDRRFWDEDGGGYFLTSDDADDVITRPKIAADNAVPPGNGTMVEVLARLHHLTGEAAYRERALAVVRVFSGVAPEHHTNLPTLCNGFEVLERAVQVVVAGPPEGAATRALVRAVFDAAPPCRVLARAAPDTALPAGHPAHGKGPVDGAPAAYVCVGPVCGLPITDPEDLRHALSRL